MRRVSFRFLVCCLRVCRTVDPAGITLSLVCWAPIVCCPPDYCTMPLRLYPSPTPAAYGTGRPDLLLSCSPPPSRTLHFRHSEGTAGEASDIAIVVRVSRRSRETPRTCRSTQPLEAQITVRSGLITFLHVNYPLSVSLAAPRHI